MDTNKFTSGQLVKFSAPMNADEACERFTVVEYRGANGPHDTAPDRVLVVAVCDMALPPSFVYNAKDLEAA